MRPRTRTARRTGKMFPAVCTFLSPQAFRARSPVSSTSWSGAIHLWPWHIAGAPPRVIARAFGRGIAGLDRGVLRRIGGSFCADPGRPRRFTDVARLARDTERLDHARMGKGDGA